MPRKVLYKAALSAGRWVARLAVPAALLFGALGPHQASAAGEFRSRGVVLPGGAVRVGDDRFRLPDNFDASLRFYRSVYDTSRFPRKAIVNEPGVKAIHVVNPDPRGEWEGFNLYEHQREVRLYILPRRK